MLNFMFVFIASVLSVAMIVMFRCILSVAITHRRLQYNITYCSISILCSLVAYYHNKS